MEVAQLLFDKYGVQAIGWGIAIFLAWKFVAKWDGNISKLTDNLTEVTSMLKVQQEQIDNIKKDREEDRQTLKTVQEVVFKVKYK